jgi:uncharacterized protein YkwD
MNLKFLRLSFCAFILCFMFSCTADEDSDLTPESSNSSAIVLNYNYNPIELETLDLINNYRISIGLNALVRINHISYKSEEHAQYMVSHDVVDHSDFNLRSDNIMKVLGAKTVSENVAYNFNSAKGVFDAWMKSKGHKENIEGNFTHFGISIRENPVNGKKYYTNIFVKI